MKVKTDKILFQQAVNLLACGVFSYMNYTGDGKGANYTYRNELVYYKGEHYNERVQGTVKKCSNDWVSLHEGWNVSDKPF